MKNIKCPKCGSEKIWKAGKRNGKQQYKCKECVRKFRTEYNYDEKFKRKAIEIFYEGNSGRAVGRIMGINKSTVYNWIKELSKEQESPEKAENKITKEIIEMDEIYTYVESKKQTHVITFVTRKPRQIVGFDVAYDKSLEKIQRIADNSPKAKLYYSDANWMYDKVSCGGTHHYSYDRNHTFTVKGINSDIRKYIPAL